MTKQEKQLRLYALQMASAKDEPSRLVVERAKEYYEFLSAKKKGKGK